MGKKSRRTNRSAGSRSGGGGGNGGGSGGNSGHRSTGLPQQSKRGESSELYRKAVMDASLEDIRKFYVQSRKGMAGELDSMFGAGFVFVSDNDVSTDEGAALAKMKYQMAHPFFLELTEPVPQMRKLGNTLKVISCEGRGSRSFIYTRGYTGIGGKELLAYGVHKSMLSHLYQTFNNMYQEHLNGKPLGHGHTISSYQEHLDGKPLGHGHTISSGNVSFLVEEPSESEAIFLKATMLLNCNKVYGLTAYDILMVRPVTLSGSDELTAREAILKGVMGREPAKNEEELKKRLKIVYPHLKDVIDKVDFSSGLATADPSAVPVERAGSTKEGDTSSDLRRIEAYLMRPAFGNVQPVTGNNPMDGLDSTTTVKPIERLRKVRSCAWCYGGFEQKLSKCSGCRKVYYCCPEHQLLHWKQAHKKDCKRLAQKDHDEDALKFMAEMMEEVKLAETEEE